MFHLCRHLGSFAWFQRLLYRLLFMSWYASLRIHYHPLWGKRKCRRRGRRRRNRRPGANPWHLIRITNTQGSPQFAVGLNPSRKSVEFSILNFNGQLQTLSWNVPQVFDTEWHKLHFGVFRDKVLLYVNCEPVGEEPLQLVDSRWDAKDCHYLFS